MGFLRKLRNKYFWSTPANLGEVDRRLRQAETDIRTDVKAYISDELISRLDEIERALASHDSKQAMFNWELYRNPGETREAARQRFFANMEPAKGPLRVFQLGTAQLLAEFDELCREADLPYWLGGGSMIGAVRHAGFIPWDDDVDLCMMRDDLDRLIALVENDDRYRISIVYDPFVACKQVRFLYNDEAIPCFLDIFIFDYAVSLDEEVLARHTELREQLKSETFDADKLIEWRDAGCLDSSDVRSKAPEHLFEEYVAQAEHENLISQQRTTQIIRSLDNFDDPNGYRWFCAIDEVFPLTRLLFEGHEVQAPRNILRFLTETYGDIYELPRDVGSHFEHVSKDLMHRQSTQDAIRAKLKDDDVV